MKFLIPKLDGDEYANLVTVFAVIIGVEYSTDGYDIWDILLGVFAIVLGSSFIKNAKKNDDFWYSFITVSLMSLGLVNIFGCFPFTSCNSTQFVPDSFNRFIIIDIIGIIIMNAIFLYQKMKSSKT